MSGFWQSSNANNSAFLFTLDWLLTFNTLFAHGQWTLLRVGLVLEKFRLTTWKNDLEKWQKPRSEKLVSETTKQVQERMIPNIMNDIFTSTLTSCNNYQTHLPYQCPIPLNRGFHTTPCGFWQLNWLFWNFIHGTFCTIVKTSSTILML